MLGHDDGEPTRIGDSLRTVSEGDARSRRRGYFSERKTGLSVPNVETLPLVRDERGWLRLAS